MEHEDKKTIWPLVWSILKYAITATIGYLSNGTIL